MELMGALITVALFFALTPGVLLTLPVGNKFAVALVHGVVYVVIVYLLERMHYMENFLNMRPAHYAPPPCTGSNGSCVSTSGCCAGLTCKSAYAGGPRRCVRW